jgi:hypothetical protein
MRRSGRRAIAWNDALVRRPLQPTIGTMRTLVAACLAGAILAACSTSDFQPEGMAVGRIDDAAQAAAAALILTDLASPATVLDVTSGEAQDINTAAYPSWVSGDPEMERAHQRFMAKLQRSAWRVRLVSPQALAAGGDCVWEELTIDQETGSVLFRVCANGIPEDE